MTSDDRERIKEEIREITRGINMAWIEGNFEKLEEYFHEDMVIAGPGFKELGRGRKACTNSYRDFMSRAMVHRFEEMEPVTDVWGDTAVASYRYEIDYEVDGEKKHDEGNDLFVFIREGGAWRAVWRIIVPVIK